MCILSHLMFKTRIVHFAFPRCTSEWISLLNPTKSIVKFTLFPVNIYIYIYIYIYIFKYILYIYILYIYIFKPLKSEAIHETGLSGYVVASFFPHIIFTYIYMYIHFLKKNLYIYIYIYICIYISLKKN